MTIGKFHARILGIPQHFLKAPVATVPSGWVELLADMRDFSKGGGVGFYTINTRSRGSVPIWIEDINKCDTDEQLVALIVKRISN